MKKLMIIVFIFVCMIGLVYYQVHQVNSNQQKPTATSSAVIESTRPPTLQPLVTLTSSPTVFPLEQAPGYLDISYEINGERVILKNGVSQVEVMPGSAAKKITQYFGNEAVGDLNGDHRKDVAFLMTQTTGGSGTFFYVVAALQTESGYEGTNAVFLGDRIAPQSTLIINDQVVVNFTDRKPDEPFTTPPSIGKTLYLKLSDGRLIELKSINLITNRKWVWISTLMNDGTRLSPKKSDAFTIIFNDNGQVSGTTDCNNFASSYTLDGDRITFGQFASTLMACEGSQESDFLQSFMQVDRFSFDQSSEQLILQIKFDSGVMIFK